MLIGSYMTGITSVDNCAAECDKETSCVSFHYYSQYSRCYKFKAGCEWEYSSSYYKCYYKAGYNAPS